MPAAATTKRIKSKRISRPFIIGSEAWPLPASGPGRPANTPPDHTKGWRVYVRAPEGQPDIARWLKKVSFKIFHTYDSPTRVFEAPPFVVEETGWGGFQIDIRLYFAPEVAAKPEYRTHYLQLEPYGDDAQKEQQLRDGMVRSEFLEVIEFNEPPEALWDALTDPAQTKTLAPGTAAGGKKGRGKAVGGTAAAAARGAKGAHYADEGATVELPPQGTPSNPFAKDMEASLMELLAKAEQQVDVLLGEEKTKVEEKRKELIALKAEE